MKHKDTIFQYLMAIVIGVCAFLVIYGYKVLIPTNVDWMMAGSDLTQHYLGWKSFRTCRWLFPIGLEDNLVWPLETSVIFTDSIPLFAVLFKILSPFLPHNFQYFGLYGLLCFILIGIFTVRIIRHFTHSKIYTTLCVAVMMLIPCFYFRMFIHTALAAQWMVLAAIEPIFCFDHYKNTNKAIVRYCLLGALIPGIHLYYLNICGIPVVGYALYEIIENKKVKKAFAIVAGYLLSAILITAMLGGFHGGVEESGYGFGELSMNLNSFFNSYGWSRFLPELPLVNRNRQGEGFAYAGLGILILFAIVIIEFIIYISKIKKMQNLKMKNQILIILTVFILAILFALSPVVTFGDQILFEYPIPNFIHDLWCVFKSTGRTAWTALYIAIFSSMVFIAKRHATRTMIVIMSAVLLIQAVDLSGKLSEIANHYKKEEFVYNTRLENTEFWNTLGEDDSYKHMILTKDFSDSPTLYSITDWSLDHNKTLNTFYFAREENRLGVVREQLLKDLPEDCLFFFFEDNKMMSIKYDLHYYLIDNMILGSRNPISYADEIDLSEIYLSNDFDNVNDSDGEYDVDAGRENGVLIIDEGGFTAGPGWIVPEGDYYISICTDAPENILVNAYSTSTGDVFNCDEEHCEDGIKTLTLHVDRDCKDLAVCIYNLSDQEVRIESLKLNYKTD